MDPRCLWLWALLTGGTLCSGSGASGWSMHVPAQITELRGHSTVLPCNFTHPNPNYAGEIRVIWKPDIFQCRVTNDSAVSSSIDNCTAGPGASGRYRLAGDPRRHNLSLHIAGLRFEDSGNYTCRVELKTNPKWTWENRSGIALTVEASPTILHLLLLPGPLPSRLACTAEGFPVPNITWLGPAGSEAGQQPQNTSGSRYQVTREVTVHQNGTYTCRAQNKHSWAESSMFVGPTGPPLSLFLLLPAALILISSPLLFLGCRRRGGCPVPRRVTAASVGSAQDAPCTGGKESLGRAQPGQADTCSPCQPAVPALAENPEGCTYADLAFPSAGAGRPGRQPGAQSCPAPEEDVTYSELTLDGGPK